MKIDDLCDRLSLSLGSPLPGSRAHRLMAPTPRPGWVPGRLHRSARAASVLILLYPRQGEAHLLLTVRTNSVEMHRGQVSFPGGVIERGESPEEAALREAEEEVGVVPSQVRVSGRLTTLHVPATGFNVTPVVGVAETRPELHPSPGEVAGCLEAAVSGLLRPGSARIEEYREAPRWLRIPYFPVEGHKVWGATAMMLAEFLTLLGWSGPPGPREAQT